jgi:hypothetical protein
MTGEGTFLLVRRVHLCRVFDTERLHDRHCRFQRGIGGFAEGTMKPLSRKTDFVGDLGEDGFSPNCQGQTARPLRANGKVTSAAALR